MNFLQQDSINNYLLVINSFDYAQQLYKLCIEKVKDGCLVLLITSKCYDFSNLLKELHLNRDELKNFILMYCETIDEMSKKLLLLHSWQLSPSLVVVDLSEILSVQLEESTILLIEKVALCAVSLLAFLQSIALKLPSVTNKAVSSNVVNGLLVLRSGIKNFGDIEIQTLKDLYFYKTELFRNVDGIRSVIGQNKAT